MPNDYKTPVAVAILMAASRLTFCDCMTASHYFVTPTFLSTLPSRRFLPLRTSPSVISLPGSLPSCHFFVRSRVTLSSFATETFVSLPTSFFLPRQRHFSLPATSFFPSPPTSLFPPCNVIFPPCQRHFSFPANITFPSTPTSIFLSATSLFLPCQRHFFPPCQRHFPLPAYVTFPSLQRHFSLPGNVTFLFLSKSLFPHLQHKPFSRWHRRFSLPGNVTFPSIATSLVSMATSLFPPCQLTSSPWQRHFPLPVSFLHLHGNVLFLLGKFLHLHGNVTFLFPGSVNFHSLATSIISMATSHFPHWQFPLSIPSLKLCIPSINNISIAADRFYTALFSTLEQTHCARL